MHQSVIEAWRQYSEPLEGRVPNLYLDILGLVTCGVGNLVDSSQSGSATPWSPALELPWKRDADGQPATKDEIRAAWQLLKSHPEYAHRSTAAARALTKLHLDDADIDALVSRKLAENAAFIAQYHLPAFKQYSADAQLGILSMAWAVGPGFLAKFPLFKSCVLIGDWLGARDNCTIRETNNPGIIPRNRANRVCFANAEIVNRCGLAPDILRWPNVAQADVPPSDRAANLGTIVVTAIEDARLFADEAANRARERLFSDNSEMSDSDESSPPPAGDPIA